MMKLLYLPAQYGGADRFGKLFAVLLMLVVTSGMARAAPLRIAALGDSLTQGYGLPEGDGLVPRLEAWLTARGHDVTIINAGVSGDTTAGGLARIGWTLTPKVGALIVNLGGNDILRGLNPGEARRNLEGILQAAKARGIPVLLVGLVAPTNYGATYKQTFDAIYPDLAAKFGALLFPDYLAPLTATGSRASVLKNYMQADGIHPNGAGVKVIIAALGPVVEKLIKKAAQK